MRHSPKKDYIYHFLQKQKAVLIFNGMMFAIKMHGSNNKVLKDLCQTCGLSPCPIHLGSNVSIGLSQVYGILWAHLWSLSNIGMPWEIIGKCLMTN